MKRNKVKEWDKNEDRNVNSFLEVEKKIYIDMFPRNTTVVEELLEGAGEDTSSIGSGGGELWIDPVN